MVPPLASEVKCPNCGATLGPARSGAEYHCTFCGHRSATPGRPPAPEPGKAGPAVDPRVAERLRRHLLWLGGYPEGERADLTGAQLFGASFSEATLSKAVFSGASLDHADLSGALACEADLSGANLAHANLSGANLLGANLSGADLSHAEMTGAILSGARLSGADLSYANNVDLTGARFWRAKLAHAKVVGGAPARRLVARLNWWVLAVVVALLAAGDLSGATKGISCSSVLGPAWDKVGGPPIVASVAGGEVVVGRLRNVGRGDQLFVGAFDGATATARWKVGPFGTYGQAYRSTHFTVSGPYVVVTDYHANVHVYDLATGAERHTVTLTDRIDGAGSVWPIPPDKAGLAQVDGRTTIIALSTGAATAAPAPASSSPRPGAPPPDGVDLEGLPRVPGFVGARAYRGAGTIVVYGHKSPGTPTPMVIGLDPGAASPRWQLPLPVVDLATVRSDIDVNTSAVHGDWFVGIYGVGQKAWHVTAVDTEAGARQWDVVLRKIFSVDMIHGLILSDSRVYIVREESLEVHDAATGALVGTIGSEEYQL